MHKPKPIPRQPRTATRQFAVRMPAELFARLRQATITHKVAAAALVRGAIAREIDHLDRERALVKRLLTGDDPLPGQLGLPLAAERKRSPRRTKRATSRTVQP